MPSVSGVPETIHRARVCNDAQVLARTVFGDETICISSNTTRCHLIWVSGWTSPDAW